MKTNVHASLVQDWILYSDLTLAPLSNSDFLIAIHILLRFSTLKFRQWLVQMKNLEKHFSCCILVFYCTEQDIHPGV